MSLFLFLLAALLTGATAAEETKPPPARSVRFFPVGESPPFRQEIRDGVRYELEAPPNSIPPRQVVPLGSDKPDAAVDLRLGRISTPVKVPSGEGPYQLLPVGGKPGDKPWYQFQRPEAGDFLVFLWRKPGPDGWSKVSHLVVPDGLLGNPAGTVRICNLFPKTVRILWSSEAIVLKAGAHVSKAIKPGAETPIVVLSSDTAGSATRYFSTTVTQNPGERGWIVLHRADGEAPRRPLKVLIIREPTPLTP